MKSCIGIAFAVVILVGVLLLQFGAAAAADVTYTPPQVPIPPVFFGMHIHRLATTTPWPTAPFGTWRLWDAYVAWINLEQQKGKWDFSKLDLYVNEAASHHVPVLLTLGLTPRWASARPDEQCPFGQGCRAEPKNLEDWRDYVRTVATRYKGRIQYYEVWNEPNGFFTGSIDQMVELTREASATLKAVDPENKVISPSATGGEKGALWLDEFLKAGGGRYVDIIGFHFYVSPRPEAIAPVAQKIRRVLEDNNVAGKPLWNTETGFLMQNRNNNVEPNPAIGPLVELPDEGAYVARAYAIAWASGISRFYWYAWDNKTMGLVEADGKTPKPVTREFGETYRWLVGAKMDTCESANEIWSCVLMRPGGYTAWMVWTTGASKKYAVPLHRQVQTVRELSGAARPLPKDGIIEIGHSPVLLERPATK